eukprot:9351-Heterococcus_DN1.PRE.3
MVACARMSLGRKYLSLGSTRWALTHTTVGARAGLSLGYDDSSSRCSQQPPARLGVGVIKGLERLQQNSERPWTAAEMTSMLDTAGKRGELVALRWLRNCGAEWPSNFYSFYSSSDEIEDHWDKDAAMWALANGCTWGDWQCEQLKQDVSEDADVAVFFAWAHEHGCPCTCNGSNAAAAAAANENN